MAKTTLVLDYILMMANNFEFNNSDIYISRKLFENYDKIISSSLNELIESLNISKSAFKKYYQMLGYQTYTQLKDEFIFLNTFRTKQIQIRYSLFNQEQRIKDMERLLNGKFIDLDLVDRLCQEIYQCNRIIFYGSPTLLLKLFDFQLDMRIFNKTVLLSSVNENKIIKPQSNDLIGICTATGRLFNSCDAVFKGLVLDNKNIKLVISQKELDSSIANYNLVIDTENDYYEMHYLFLFYLDLIKTRYYELYVKEDEDDYWKNNDGTK